MKYGLHFRSWDGLFTNDKIMDIAAEAKSLGAETFEVFPPEYVLNCETDKIHELKKKIDELGIEFFLTSKYPPDADLASEDPEERARAIAFMTRYIQGASELGVRKIGGIVYSVWPHRYDNDMIDPQIKYERTMRSIEGMRKLMVTAEKCGVHLDAEIVNRFEHYMMNTAQEAIDYCDAVDSPNFGILFDVFHANIEEDSIEDAIRLCRSRIDHFHVSEPNRRVPYHNGRINWQSIGNALKETGYDGSVTLEPILLFLGKASYNSRLFRDLIDDRSQEARLEIIKNGLDFIKGNFN